jgi:hypothetical protein
MFFVNENELCDAEVIVSDMEQNKESTAVHGTDGSKKRKNSTKTVAQSKKKKETPEQMTNLLKETPVTKLFNFCEKKMGKNIITEDDQLVGLCEIIQNNSDGTFHPAVLLIIWAVHCPMFV